MSEKHVFHAGSKYIINSHLASPLDDYLSEFLHQILATTKKKEFYPKKMLVKNKRFYEILTDILSGLNIEIELVKRTASIEQLKKHSKEYFK